MRKSMVRIFSEKSQFFILSKLKFRDHGIISNKVDTLTQSIHEHNYMNTISINTAAPFQIFKNKL